MKAPKWKTIAEQAGGFCGGVAASCLLGVAAPATPLLVIPAAVGRFLLSNAAARVAQRETRALLDKALEASNN